MSSTEIEEFSQCVAMEIMCNVASGEVAGGRAIWNEIEKAGGQDKLNELCPYLLRKNCNKIYSIAMETWGEGRFYREKENVSRTLLAGLEAAYKAKVANAERERVKAEQERIRAEREMAKAEQEQVRAERERLQRGIKESGQPFTDSRDGKKYIPVLIGDNLWMAQNLNYEPSSGNSRCYDNNISNCDKYGRLYDWKTALTACPSGWHLPSNQEWRTLVNYAGGNGAGKKLKVGSEWRGSNGSGTDAYKFSAMPGGGRHPNGSFFNVDKGGYWWTATEVGSSYAYYSNMGYGYDDVDLINDHKSYGFSVRCVRD